MAFKSLMVHLDDGERSAERLDLAVRLASRFGGSLIGVYLVPTGELTPSVAALLPAETVRRRLADSGDAQRDAEALFRQVAAAGRVAHAEWRAPAGYAIDAAVAHARCADLAIIGQPDPDDGESSFARRLAEHVLLGAACPAVFVPYTGTGADVGTRVLVAWDGGREASRAVRDALPILETARDVVVVSLAREPADADAIALAQPRLAAYLHAHGIDATFKRFDGDPIQGGERLLSQAADLGSDLIVMGGYAHSRSRELILGGVTRTMFESMTVPVLMSH
ncbi:MAG TPA: universal stress protein [Casimicrobiaceae bacterium]|nr:universal stress protein [Casimicrobiaceae bacterium]